MNIEFTIGQARAILRLVDFARLAKEARVPVKCGLAPQVMDEAEKAAITIRQLCGPQLAESPAELAPRDPWEHNPGARPMPHPGAPRAEA